MLLLKLRMVGLFFDLGLQVLNPIALTFGGFSVTVLILQKEI